MTNHEYADAELLDTLGTAMETSLGTALAAAGRLADGTGAARSSDNDSFVQLEFVMADGRRVTIELVIEDD